ncbi:MAG: hypothetical protein CBB71_17405 [Rhodopirellula sp. TMED11]|nr:MAG: hypothetical protein CBB71_17405 [Rhodopirellula sp. TMED11]
MGDVFSDWFANAANRFQCSQQIGAIKLALTLGIRWKITRNRYSLPIKDALQAGHVLRSEFSKKD